MTTRRELPRLYLITDRHAAATDLVDVVARALAGVGPGELMVQLREKDLEAHDLAELARHLVQLTRAHQCSLVINDRIDVALAVAADGVHLPESGFSVADARELIGPRMRIGVSTHSASAARAACKGGADFVVCGPVWDTPSKRGKGEPIGLREFADAATSLVGKVYAIGGVTGPDRASSARDAGAHGVAAIRAIVAAPSPGDAARDLCRVFPQQ